MSIKLKTIPVDSPIDETIDETITCANCKACCCRLEVLLFTDTGVPKRYINEDKWGTETMRRDDDGWCTALDRNTLMCSIYESRPLVCRVFEMGSTECITERQEHM